MIGRGSGSFPVASLVSVLVKRLFWVSEQLDVNSLQTTTGEKSVKHGGEKMVFFPHCCSFRPPQCLFVTRRSS